MSVKTAFCEAVGLVRCAKVIKQRVYFDFFLFILRHLSFNPTVVYWNNCFSSRILFQCPTPYILTPSLSFFSSSFVHLILIRELSLGFFWGDNWVDAVGLPCSSRSISSSDSNTSPMSVYALSVSFSEDDDCSEYIALIGQGIDLWASRRLLLDATHWPITLLLAFILSSRPNNDSLDCPIEPRSRSTSGWHNYDGPQRQQLRPPAPCFHTPRLPSGRSTRKLCAVFSLCWKGRWTVGSTWELARTETDSLSSPVNNL